MTILFFVAAALLFVAFIMQGKIIVSKGVYLIAIAAQIAATICCFLRKN